MIAAFLAALLSFAADEPKPDVPLAIAHVGVVDLDDRRPLRDATVVIQDDRIVAVGNSAEVAVPEGAKMIDGHGKFLIPGLWDMHVHFSNQASMPLFVANGVTGVRVMWGTPRSASPWAPKNDFRLKSLTKDDFARQKVAFARAVDCVGRLHRAGVPILAGTDELNPYVFPGFSLHDELALLVKAGLSPREALRAATINPAKLLGKEATMGTVDVGKAADLVLLDADPLADIANTTKIRAVIVRGRLLDREALDRMLKAAEWSK
jgi:imidazolonepropionase-like amidohydrolase